MNLRVRPTFISFLGFWLALSCVVGLLLPPWLVVGHADSYALNGVAVSREEFRSFLIPLLPWFAALAVFSGVTSWSIFNESPRSRPFAVAWIMIIVTGAPMLPGGPRLADTWPIVLLMSVLVGLPVLWYFFRKRDVVAYYAELHRERL